MFKLFFDGAASPNPGIMGVGASLVDPNGVEIDCIAKNCGTGTNNQAEYFSLVEGIKLLKRHNVSNALIAGDSRLVINQMTGVWNCHDEKLKAIKSKATHLLADCDVEYRWIRRDQNERADELSKLGLEKAPPEPEQVKKIQPAENERTPLEVIYHAGIGFSVIEKDNLYAVNLNPQVVCSCGSEKSQCRHIKAAFEYAQKQRAAA